MFLKPSPPAILSFLPLHWMVCSSFLSAYSFCCNFSYLQKISFDLTIPTIYSPIFLLHFIATFFIISSILALSNYSLPILSWTYSHRVSSPIFCQDCSSQTHWWLSHSKSNSHFPILLFLFDLSNTEQSWSLSPSLNISFGWLTILASPFSLSPPSQSPLLVPLNPPGF